MANSFWNETAFSVKNVLMNLQTTSKKETIALLLENLARTQGLSASPQYLLGKIMEREYKGSTGMQNGIALPHLRCDCTQEFLVAIGIHPLGVDFQSLDAQPAKIILLSLVPHEMVNEQLQYLAKVSVLLSSEELRGHIIAGKNNTEVYNLLCENI